jgi:predicted ATPase
LGRHEELAERQVLTEANRLVTLTGASGSGKTRLALGLAAELSDQYLEPGFEPDQTVGEICERLDRLPLALELAPTRVTLMSTAQMLERIEQRLDLLSKGKRDAPDRQATMRATIGGSYYLRPQPEQVLFQGLGVVAGSFELEAAEAVCEADLDDLQSLIDKSLLRRDGHGRFFLLELTREYALEQLHQKAGEQATLERRHADWFVALARLAEEHLESGERAGPVDILSGAWSCFGSSATRQGKRPCSAASACARSRKARPQNQSSSARQRWQSPAS